MRIMMMAIAGTLAFTACDGPKQKAGEAQDQERRAPSTSKRRTSPGVKYA